MSKELEALDRLTINCPEYDRFSKYSIMGDKFLIKSALERKEKLEKVWEIVKNKGLCQMITFFENYNDFLAKHGNILTENEFNLLKEMLK